MHNVTAAAQPTSGEGHGVNRNPSQIQYPREPNGKSSRTGLVDVTERPHRLGLHSRCGQ